MNLQVQSILGKSFFYLYSVIMETMKNFWSYIKWFVGKVWAYVTIPFLTFLSRKYLIRSVLWFIFTVGLSLIGTIANIIKIAFLNIPRIDEKYTFWDRVVYSVSQDCKSGTFYTFAIVLVASMLYPLFEGFLKHEFNYINARVLSIIAALLLLVFGGMFYSFSSVGNKTCVESGELISHVDWYQFGFLLLAIIVASYSFSVGLMIEDKDNPHPEIDDFADADSQNVERLKAKVKKPVDGIDNVTI